MGACRQLSGRRLPRLSTAPGVTDRWERKLRAAPQKGAAFTVCQLEIQRESVVSVAPGVGSPPRVTVGTERGAFAFPSVYSRGGEGGSRR